MTRSQGDHPGQAFDLLATFVEASDAPKRLAWLPTAGTLPHLTQRWERRRFGTALPTALRSLGQVIFINNPISGLLLLLALLAQTPVMGLFAALGVATANLNAKAIGCDRGARRNGIYGFNGALVGSYNDILTAIALGGTFYATTGGSILIALVAAAGSSLVAPAVAPAFASPGLPVLTLPFIVATLATFAVVRRALPSLLPVALHSVLTPEEHRQRFVVATALLSEFRRQLSRALAGERQLALLPLAPVSQRQRQPQRGGAGRRAGAATTWHSTQEPVSPAPGAAAGGGGQGHGSRWRWPGGWGRVRRTDAAAAPPVGGARAAAHRPATGGCRWQ
ncbi:urea transporter [Cyanobium sp. AMD-g]|nr:urea transporter [Cyanobium sp. AMD-g]MCP9931763.1 urea transporter [Cyanobium sp. AMD-g]